jgi:hypothetical protein
MYDNKIRLSQDVLEKAELIAEEWGLKNARAAVEAVFRRYSDDYLSGRGQRFDARPTNVVSMTSLEPARKQSLSPTNFASDCEALDALDDLLAM